jgi:hypothetical protein
MLTFVAGCATNGAKVDTFCLTERPTYLTAAEVDALPITVARQILARNEYGAKRCGWRSR